MDVEYLLTATRFARRSLDLGAPVDHGDIRECLRIALQAANGSNQQSWRWLAILHPMLRERIAALHRDAYLRRVGGQMIGDLLPADTPEGRLMSSTEWLVENLARVPLLVRPYLPRIDGDESFYQATLYGSIFPAVWIFALALYRAGYGTCVTTLHLHHEEAVRELLGIPDGYVQGCLLPVAPLRAGHRFRSANRRAVDEVGAVDGWNGPPIQTGDAPGLVNSNKHLVRQKGLGAEANDPLVGRSFRVRHPRAAQVGPG